MKTLGIEWLKNTPRPGESFGGIGAIIPTEKTKTAMKSKVYMSVALVILAAGLVSRQQASGWNTPFAVRRSTGRVLLHSPISTAPRTPNRVPRGRFSPHDPTARMGQRQMANLTRETRTILPAEEMNRYALRAELEKHHRRKLWLGAELLRA